MKTTKKILTSLIILGLISLVFIVFLVYPLFNEIKKESQNLISQKRTLVELTTKTQNLKKFQATYNTYQENLEKIDKLFVNPTEPLNFIEFLETEAADSQLLIEIFPSPSQEIAVDPWPSLNFQLTLIGSFPNFLKFLEKLESSSYLIEVLNLNIRRLTENEGDINVTLLIKIYTK